MREFGTDGMRGRANRDVTVEVAMALGNAMAAALADGPARIGVARDSRTSGPMLDAACVAGICAAGGEAVRLGVLPTPGVSALVPMLGLHGGVVVTASHNPPEDNGLKAVDALGEKLSGPARARVVERLRAPLHMAERPGPVSTHATAGDDYVRAVLDRLPKGRWLAGCSIVLDTANGASVNLAARVVAALGARVLALGVEGGDRINVGCGALHPALMAAAVRAHGAAAGIALDGDGDRVALADAAGRVHDGDAVMWLCARGDVMIGTVMTNGGLVEALAARGIELVRTAVGDANVAAEMRARGAAIGGEPAGHVVFDDGLPTADGLLAGLRALYPGPETLSHRLEPLRIHPQAHGAVPAARARIEACDAAVLAIEAQGARVVLRRSGTEPVVRAMVEHPDEGVARAGLNTLLHLLEQT